MNELLQWAGIISANLLALAALGTAAPANLTTSAIRAGLTILRKLAARIIGG